MQCNYAVQIDFEAVKSHARPHDSFSSTSLESLYFHWLVYQAIETVIFVKVSHEWREHSGNQTFCKSRTGSA